MAVPRALRLALIAATAALLGGCGEDERIGDALAYLPREAPLVATVSTDLEGDQLTQLDAKLRRLGVLDRGLEVELEEGARRELGVSWAEDVKPLLGNRAAVGVPAAGGLSRGSPPVLVALEVRDRERLLRLALDVPEYIEPAGETSGARLFRARGQGRGGLIAVKNDELVLADSRPTLVAALRRRDVEGGLTEVEFDARAGEVSADAALRAYADIESLRRELPLVPSADTRELRRVPWYAALRTVGLAFGASKETLDLELAAATDPTGLSPRELPLAPDVGPPGVPGRRPEPVVGLRNPAHLLRFGLDALRSTDPEGESSRSIRRDERRLGIDLRRDVLDQLSGDSVFTPSRSGRELVRFDVRDPARAAGTLRKVAIGLPRLSADSPLGLGIEGVRVRRIPGDELLYRISSGRGRLVLGLVDNRLVYGPEREARALAREPVAQLEGLEGALTFRADGPRTFGLLFDPASERTVGDLTGSVDASTRRVRLTVRQAVR